MIVNVRFRNLKNSTVLMWTSTPEAEAASSVGENKARRPVWGQKVGHDGHLVSACFKSWFMDSNLTFVFSSVTSTEYLEETKLLGTKKKTLPLVWIFCVSV